MATKIKTESGLFKGNHMLIRLLGKGTHLWPSHPASPSTPEHAANLSNNHVDFCSKETDFGFKKKRRIVSNINWKQKSLLFGKFRERWGGDRRGSSNSVYHEDTRERADPLRRATSAASSSEML